MNKNSFLLTIKVILCVIKNLIYGFIHVYTLNWRLMTVGLFWVLKKFPSLEGWILYREATHA